MEPAVSLQGQLPIVMLFKKGAFPALGVGKQICLDAFPKGRLLL